MKSYRESGPSIGPIPPNVRKHWLGDKPYPRPSAADKHVQLVVDAENRRAVRELDFQLPDFAVSANYERVFIGRNDGRVYRLHTRDTMDAMFSDHEAADNHVRANGYKRLPEHDTNTKLAYDRGPRGPRT